MTPFITRTVGDVIAEIVMSRSAFGGSLLLVEGDSDSKFWVARIERGECQIVIAGSKPTVVSAVVGANAVGVKGILGIVDDDYDSLCGIPTGSPNVLRTDARDLEVLLLRSAALERVIYEVADSAKVSALENAEGPLRSCLVGRALLFGRLRWLDKRNAWLFDFGSLSPWRFTDTQKWAIDEDATIAAMAGAIGKTPEDLRSALAALPSADPFLILHGKDATNLLCIGLRGKLGSQQCPAERASQMLRLAFDEGMARVTALFQQIWDWEARNPPYRILRFAR